jgi:hypothetical protein
MNDLKVGDRVRAKNLGAYRGKTATVHSFAGPYAYLRFDFVDAEGDSKEVNDAHGGTWNPGSLEKIEDSLEAELAEAKAAAEVLAAEAERLRLCWRYAISLLDQSGKDRANGYFDALVIEKR